MCVSCVCVGVCVGWVRSLQAPLVHLVLLLPLVRRLAPKIAPLGSDGHCRCLKEGIVVCSYLAAWSARERPGRSAARASADWAAARLFQKTNARPPAEASAARRAPSCISANSQIDTLIGLQNHLTKLVPSFKNASQRYGQPRVRDPRGREGGQGRPGRGGQGRDPSRFRGGRGARGQAGRR